MSLAPQKNRRNALELLEDVKSSTDALWSELNSLIEENTVLQRKLNEEEDIKQFHIREIKKIRECIGELEKKILPLPEKKAAAPAEHAADLQRQLESSLVGLGQGADEPRAGEGDREKEKGRRERGKRSVAAGVAAGAAGERAGEEREEARERGDTLPSCVSCLSSYTFPSAVSSTAITRDGATIAAGCNGVCYVITKRSAEMQCLLHHPTERVVEEHYSPSIEAVKGSVEKHVRGLSFTPDGKVLTTAIIDRALRMWDVENKRLLYTIEDNTSDVYYGVVSSSRYIYACCNNGVVKIVRLSTGEIVDRVVLDGARERVFISIAMTPDEGFLFLGTTDCSVVAYNIRTKQKAGEWRDHTKNVYCLDISEDGRLLASGSLDNSFIVYAIREKEKSPLIELSRVHGPFHHEQFVLSVAFSKDSKHLLTGSRDTTIRMWDLAGDVRPETSFLLKAHEDSVLSIATAAGYFVSGGVDKKLKIFAFRQEREK